eukprot:maker-scaffold1258_size52332-snap-gene-0.9 protein:Tk02595 transcript:maker-scaffold1258_size52332-snap-gene-0.9-mRNA-1 annotation:"unnamed protein product"
MFRNLVTLSVRYRGSRTPKRVFDPEGQPISVLSDRLEDNVQARDIALRAQRELRGTRLGPRAQAPIATPLTAQDYESPQPIQAVLEAGQPELDHPQDHLPEGFEWESLPRFQKITAWDKTNPELKQLKKNLSSSSQHEWAVIVEGKRLLKDVMKAGLQPFMLAFSRVNLLLDLPFEKGRKVNMYQIPYKNIRAWSELKTPPGIIAAFHKTDFESLALKNVEAQLENGVPHLPITLLLDNIRNPDNLGTILRTASAINCRQVLLTKGCANPWEGKVFRAGSGAHLFLPMKTGLIWEQIHEEIPQFSQVVMADLNRKSPLEETVEMNQISAQVEELNEECAELHIPTEVGTKQGGWREVFTKKEQTELGALKNDELKSLLEKKLASEEVEEDSPTCGYLDHSYNNQAILDKFQAIPIPTSPYHEFQHFGPNQEIIVIIGGETHGISPQAVKFTHHYSGERLFIPLRHGINSLNVASAASVILMEIQKSLEKSKDDV